MPRFLLLVVVALLVSACPGGSDDGHEEPSPSATASSEPAETPSPHPTLSPPQTAVQTPEPGAPVVRWLPLRYAGPAEVTFLSQLLEGSEALNDEVIFQVESVLEDERGWQQAGVDFQRVTDIPASLNEGTVDLFVFVSNPGTFPCASAGGQDTVVVGCSVAGEFPTDPPCVLIIPDLERSNVTVNHEVGHCLRILHNPAPGVMSQFINIATEWPTPDEIAVVRRLLDPFR
ncbi:MAG TPA: hypothetical protein VFZ12_00220 [Dehalococcoidia bacterium]|nr:hypothetical protein [Dehalococcoidia bacterium]